MDDMPLIPHRKDDGYTDIRTGPGETRAMFAPHAIFEDGMVRFVHPAQGMMLGSMRAIDSDEMQPTLRMDHAMGPLSLLFIPNAEELRALGKAMIETADHMEAAAADMLAAALAKKPGE